MSVQLDSAERIYLLAERLYKRGKNEMRPYFDRAIHLPLLRNIIFIITGKNTIQTVETTVVCTEPIILLQDNVFLLSIPLIAYCVNSPINLNNSKKLVGDERPFIRILNQALNFHATPQLAVHSAHQTVSSDDREKIILIQICRIICIVRHWYHRHMIDNTYESNIRPKEIPMAQRKI